MELVRVGLAAVQIDKSRLSERGTVLSTAWLYPTNNDRRHMADLPGRGWCTWSLVGK